MDYPDGNIIETGKKKYLRQLGMYMDRNSWREMDQIGLPWVRFCAV